MTYNINEGVRDFLKNEGILGLRKTEQLKRVVQAVAEIPWGEGRTVEEVLSLRKVGTCTGKHLLLQACFDELGIEYRTAVCTFRWGDQHINYPKKLRDILNEGEWEHGHNFVQIATEDGEYTDVDITWNSSLKGYGFETFPKNWDGKSGFVGVDNIIKRYDGANIADMKKELIESLSPKLRERRGRFLKGFIGWIKSINERR